MATKWVDDWTKANLDPIMGPPHQPYRLGHAELVHHVQEVFAQEAPDVPLVRLICNQHMNPFLGRQALQYAHSKGYRFDAIGTARYVEPAGLDWTTLDTLWAGDAASKDQAICLVLDAFSRGLANLDGPAKQYKAMAEQYGCRLVTYEIGPGWSIPANWPKGRQDLFLAVHRDPRMREFLEEQYFPWIATYYDLIMYTQDCDRPSPGILGAKANADDNDCRNGKPAQLASRPTTVSKFPVGNSRLGPGSSISKLKPWVLTFRMGTLSEGCYFRNGTRRVRDRLLPSGGGSSRGPWSHGRLPGRVSLEAVPTPGIRREARQNNIYKP